MPVPPSARRHRRAVGQLLLGLVPLLVGCLAVLLALALRLPQLQAPLAAADRTAPATVTATGRPPEGRGLAVEFTDAAGRPRAGLVELPRRLDVPVGARLPVRYDPEAPAGSPVAVYTDGDAAHAAVTDVVFGLVVVALVLLVATVLTSWRLATRPRLRRRPPTRVPATHLVLRQGLLVRSCLELDTPAGPRRLPVHWRPELDRMSPGTPVEVRGDPARDRIVLPVVDGAEVWPSGRLRADGPRGTLRPAPVDPAAEDVGLARQARADAVVLLLAPVLGLLWAYVDGTGPGGFAAATAVAAGVLFWLAQLLGSDPRAPGRG